MASFMMKLLHLLDSFVKGISYLSVLCECSEILRVMIKDPEKIIN